MAEKSVEARVVVTGGAGFIGSHLVDALLERGRRVVAVDDLSSGFAENVEAHTDNPAFEFIDGDIRSPLQVDGPVDLVLNFASSASPPLFLARPLETLETGSLGTKHVIALAEAKGARLIQASTSEVYGEPLVHPQTEEYWGNVNPIGPRSVYDEAKRYGEALIAAHVRLGRLDAGIVRIFNTYGPRLRASDGRVVSNFVHQALNGNPLTVYGTGEQTRSFCYVEDLVRGVLALAAREGQMGPVNLGNPEEITVLELAETISEFTGTALSVVHRPLPLDDPTQRRPDITRARQLLGWEPRVGLREGLRRTISWFKDAVS
ncbi:UDP-glucuronic acid decarboxylase family protein [Actinokineospora pegani]|uniref:UDP-glucuronic acid decarboxylase family protein n=1 Tax=Actinokineospora pegani TaxID=2654637 RepID=UPI0018D3C5FF|nr:UDP-glucuronic acid decarboxylase family protein [Actinokineospora pegani]